MLTAWWSFWQNILNIHLWRYELNVGIIYIYIKGHKKYIKVQQTTQMRTGLALSMNIVGCNTTTQRRTGPIHIRCISPWYNCTGWLGVKHQLTYYPWALLAATPHKWELVLSYPWALLAATPHEWQLVLSYPWVLPLALPKPRSIAQLSSSKRCCCSVVFQKILLQCGVPKDLVAVVFQKILLQCGVPKDLVAVVFQKILLQWCSRRSCCCGVPEDLVAVVFQKILLQCGVPEDLVAVVFQKILLLWCSRRSCCCGVFQKILLLWCSRRSCCCGVPDLVAVVFQKILLLWCSRSCCCGVVWPGMCNDRPWWWPFSFSVQLHVLTQTVWWLSLSWPTSWEEFTELHKHRVIGIAWLSWCWQFQMEVNNSLKGFTELHNHTLFGMARLSWCWQFQMGV